MTNQSAKFASAIIATLLAGAAITISASSFAHARECQTKPGSETRQGQQWRYRTDRATNRQCWFLATRGSIADAHNELPLPTVQDRGASAALRELVLTPAPAESVPPVAPGRPEPLAMNSPISPDPEGSSTRVADANPTPQEDPSPVPGPETLAEGQASTQTTVGSFEFQLLLLLILGTLAMASLTEELVGEILFQMSKRRRSDLERLLLR